MDRFVNREAVRLAFEEVPVLDAVRVRRQDGAVRTGIGLCTLNRITTTAARHVNWQRHALRRGRCDETLAACRWKTSLAVLPCQRRWTPWFFPAYWRWSERLWTWRRPSGHLHCKEWRWRFLEFPYAGPYGQEEKTRKAPPRRRGEQKAGAQFRTMEYRTAADHMDDGCGPGSVRRLDMDPHRTFKTCSPGSEIATGGLSGNVETRRRADSKKLEMADLKKAAAPLALRICGDFAGFGRKMKHRTFLNLSALKFPTILVSSGRRGFSIVTGSRNYWRRSGSDHRYRKHQPASEWLLRTGGADENQRRQKTRRCRRH